MRRGGGLAYPLLVVSAFLWACNAVAGRWAPGEVSPQVITTLRWTFPCLILAVLARRRIEAEWDGVRRNWLRILLMGAGGFTAFASLFYAAGAYTTAVNLALF